MKIIYMHHAERDLSNRYENMTSAEKQLDYITDTGRREAKDLAKILNKYLDVDIIENSRFNEAEESWNVALTRIQEGIKSIINKYDNDDIIICVTSGVNITAFMCLELDKKLDEKTPYVQALTMSPVIFNYMII